ncbi:DUF4232 domain-containing protein [Streptomyces sp. ISL-36]|uniref:DUF4232 domain-containing protein n=1 Tax=Streptomyces sp. ISL-36 TaxID=2819182 RepID=UPI001BE78DB6|nr:DUF4232 domain-containing protein [Streptomyces sp. ISL-36]MBT2441664.1 DUF4232 domain-containing protein [Streptomyces sp. ISL-36]
MRTIRTIRVTAAATALLAGLSLTACQADGTTSTAPTHPPATTTAVPTPSATTTPTQEATHSPTARPGSDKPAGTTKPSARPTTRPTSRPSDGSGPTTAPCTGSTAKVTASKVSRPINHLLLTVTNVGSRPCNAYGAPFVGFDDAQSPLHVLQDSKPQAVVTLAPGESGYASVILTGDPGESTGGRTVRKISVHFAPGDGSGGSVGPARTVAAPSGTYADDNATVSYWQHDMDDALMY